MIFINPNLERFIPLVDFLAEVLGKDAEIVLQDVSDFHNSVVAIRNNHVSGRGVGAPATNLVLKVMSSGNYTEKNYEANYKGLSGTGKVIKSSTFFIKDDTKKVIGMLCINLDVDKFVQLRNYLDCVLELPQEIETEKALERFSNTTEELAMDSIKSVIEESGIIPERMSQQEKIEIIKKLNENGAFLIKGSVSKTAISLKVSEATVYRYLSKIKKEEI